MNEQRRSERKAVANPLQAIDTLTAEVIGHISNLSLSGLLLISTRPLNEDALYQVRFLLPREDGRPHTLEIGIHEQWNEPAATPGQYWAGCRIVSIAPADLSILDAWLDSSGAAHA